jgi:hypothetical protein
VANQSLQGLLLILLGDDGGAFIVGQSNGAGY